MRSEHQPIAQACKLLLEALRSDHLTPYVDSRIRAALIELADWQMAAGIAEFRKAGLTQEQINQQIEQALREYRNGQ